jgi:hypothetical protein
MVDLRLGLSKEFKTLYGFLPRVGVKVKARIVYDMLDRTIHSMKRRNFIK